jgi:SAM-dependent MidA family methyltransferase
MPTDLERKLIAHIQRQGPMTFRDFMQAALYDPQHGYYNSERAKIGPTGDYYTSSNVHPVFGAILAKAFTSLWQQTAAPLTIIEFGAGTGQLALDLITALRDQSPATTFDQLRYVIVEISPTMRKLQKEKLAQFGERISWRSIEELNPVEAIIFSNEFVDAMPVHRIRAQGATLNRRACLQELYVTFDGQKLMPVWGEPSTPELQQYLKRMKVKLANGQIIEINLDAIRWLARISRVLARGFLVTIDYGDLAPHLYGEDRREGTLRSFHRHTLVASPLERVGEQDITASVNFTALIEYGRDFGFELVSYQRQSAFLMQAGLIERIATMISGSEHAIAGDELKERLAIKNLFVPGGVSDNLRVLIQRK